MTIIDNEDSSKAAKSAQSRARILASAEKLFAAHGLHGVTLNAVAAMAGLGNAGLLHHFPSKLELYRALLEQLAGEALLMLEAELAGACTPAGRWQAFVDSQADWTMHRPDAAMLVLRELLDNNERVDTAHVFPLLGLVRRFRQEIEAAQAAGLIPRQPSLIALAQLLGTHAYGLAVYPTFLRMYPNASELASREQWIRGLSRPFSAGKTGAPR